MHGGDAPVGTETLTSVWHSDIRGTTPSDSRLNPRCCSVCEISLPKGLGGSVEAGAASFVKVCVDTEFDEEVKNEESEEVDID